MRRSVIAGASFALASLVALAGVTATYSVAGDASSAPGKPTETAAIPTSVVLITLDTTRADRLGCYGAEDAATPRIDGLALAGTRFDRAVSPAPLTAPAHASVMTGLVPRRHGVRDNALYPLDGEIPVLAELLAAAGYDTAAAVSSAVLDRGLGLERGFRLYDDAVRVGRRSAFNYEERAASQTNDAAFAQLASLEPPFLLWVHYFDPHLPYVPPPPFDTDFAASPYDGEIAFMDREVGRLLDAVRRRAPGALIVVAGDHGESLGEHGEAAHGVFVYQSTQRVPWILAGPGVPRGRVVDRRVGLVDLLPTVLELLDVAPPAGLDGRSLLPFAPPPGARRRRESDYEMESHFPRLAYGWASLRGLVRGSLVLIEAPRPELYDLDADPRELRNLWAERGGRAVVAEMVRSLDRLAENDALAAVVPDEALAERRMRVGSLGYTAGMPGVDGGDGIDPKDGIPLLATLDDARAAVQLGRAAAAVEPLLEVLRRNPSNVPAWLTLAAARLAGGEATAAVTAARRAVTLRPDDDLVRFNLANALSAEAAERPAASDEAREQYEATLRLNPRRADAYLNFAALLARTGELARVRDLLERAERAGVEDPDIWVERAVLELRAGAVDAATVYFERALALNPHDARTREALARIALRRGRHEDARRHLERLLAAAAGNGEEQARIRSLLQQLPDVAAPER